jgi:hypothetical protein
VATRDSLFTSNEHRQARVASGNGCVVPLITVEHFVSIGITAGELPHRDRRYSTSVRGKSEQDRCQPILVESDDTTLRSGGLTSAIGTVCTTTSRCV